MSRETARAPFDASTLARLDEPVRRYLAHALRDGGNLHERVELTMAGRIKVGPWLAFSARQGFDGHEFSWEARAGLGPFRPIHVVDRYRDGRGSTDGRILGRLRFLHADDEHTARAAAARGAVESIWVPATLLPGPTVSWRVEGDDHIVASVSVPPEEADVHLRLDPAGAVRSVWVNRWGNIGQAEYGYIPFGGDVGGERRFGDVVIPNVVTVGWWYGTACYRPFFEATVSGAVPLAP